MDDSKEERIELNYFVGNVVSLLEILCGVMVDVFQEIYPGILRIFKEGQNSLSSTRKIIFT